MSDTEDGNCGVDPGEPVKVTYRLIGVCSSGAMYYGSYSQRKVPDSIIAEYRLGHKVFHNGVYSHFLPFVEPDIVESDLPDPRVAIEQHMAAKGLEEGHAAQLPDSSLWYGESKVKGLVRQFDLPKPVEEWVLSAVRSRRYLLAKAQDIAASADKWRDECKSQKLQWNQLRDEFDRLLMERDELRRSSEAKTFAYDASLNKIKALEEQLKHTQTLYDNALADIDRTEKRKEPTLRDALRIVYKAVTEDD